MDIAATNIQSIDFDITLNRDIYAQATIEKAYPRCKAYYCFKNNDTREDSEDHCTHETFTCICNTIGELLSTTDNNKTTPAIKCRIVLHMLDKSKLAFNESDISTSTMKTLINYLTDKIDEYSFLSAFIPYL